MIRKICVTASILFVTVFVSCLDPFNPPEGKKDVSYLVVDAFLNASENTCTVTLTRTVPLASTGSHPESNASVMLEDSNGATELLIEQNSGRYAAYGLTLDYTKTYKLKITTHDAKVYESDPVHIHDTPAIDSVVWRKTPSEIGIYVNTHDPQNNTHYYQWKYTETWQYRSAFYSTVKLENDHVLTRQPGEYVYDCWQTLNSSNVMVATSEKFAQDIISQFAVSLIPLNSVKLSVGYSILVEQRAVDHQNYEYLQQLKNNSEDLGTIFDPLPSEIFGNVHGVSNPAEIVLGYFSASTVQKQRIFFSKKDLDFEPGHPFDTGYEGCTSIVILYGNPFGELYPMYTAYDESSGVPIPIGYHASTLECIDCQLKGGVNYAPDFWDEYFEE